MTDDSPARQPRDNRAPIPVSSTPRQPPWDLTLLVDQLHMRFDHDRAFVVLQARLVRALDPSESR